MEFVCFVWISEQTANFVLKTIKRVVFITQADSVYCAARTEFLYNQTRFVCCWRKKITNKMLVVIFDVLTS
jgi:hypothetical protein